MATANPERIQPEDWSFPNSPSCSSTTAILIHDGGGTTYPYHCLGALYRNVYGIRNPYFFSGDIFPGGLPEMGKVYADYIRDAIKSRQFKARRKLDGSVDILLGGWSLGGYLTLEVAKQLQDDRKINVVGMVLIDSPYSAAADKDQPPAEPLDFDEDGKTRNEVLSLRSMSEAVRMLETWEPPKWTGRHLGKRPKCVLVKCRDYFPTKNGELSTIDLLRDDDTLGWSGYDKKMFTKVLELPGHHFNIFDGEHIDGTTRAIQSAFDKLTAPSARQRMLSELQCM
jgi:thioesterase domain-containing protein